MKNLLKVGGLWLVACLWPVSAHADWINLSGAETSRNIAEIYVEEGRVRVVLEIFVGDLEQFRDLVPDDLIRDKAATAGRLPLSERLQRFSRETLRIETGSGAALPATALKIEPKLRKDRFSPFAGMVNPFTRQRVPSAPPDKRVLYAELAYAFPAGAPPKSLTIVPPADRQGRARATIGFIAYHKAVPIIDFRYLGAPAGLNLNWDDPWYTKFDNPNLKRHHKDALMSFLYVEPREVRHEVLVRVRDLQEWADLGLKIGDRIRPGEKAVLKQKARAFFEARNPLQIDGTPYKPDSSRAEFLKISLRGLQVIEDEVPLDSTTAIIGIILSYPVEKLPQKVNVKWELFTPRIDRVPTTATDPAGPLKSYIDREDPTIKWENFLRKYTEPAVVPVEHDGGHSVGVPALSLILILAAVFAGVLTVRPRYLPRYGWAGMSVICVVGAVFLVRSAVVEIRNPFAGPPADTAAAEIVTALLNNVHTAYLERRAPRLEQALGIVVSETGFADVKAELGRALAIRVAGGGIARVNAIRDLDVSEIVATESGDGFRSVVEWTALASAGHWGHAHRRRIRFRALMELEEIDSAWKISGLTIVDSRQES